METAIRIGLQKLMMEHPNFGFSTLVDQVTEDYNNTVDDVTKFAHNFLFTGITCDPSLLLVDIKRARKQAAQNTRDRQAIRSKVHVLGDYLQLKINK